MSFLTEATLRGGRSGFGPRRIINILPLDWIRRPFPNSKKMSFFSSVSNQRTETQQRNIRIIYRE